MNNARTVFLIVVLSFVAILAGCPDPAVIRDPKGPVLAPVDPIPVDPTPVVVKPADTVAAGPAIIMHDAVQDLGEVGPNSKSTLKFKFSNTGGQDLKIERIRSTCGCSVPKLDKLVYAPGESGEVTVNYVASGFGQPISRDLFIVSNAVNAPEAVMTIKSVSVIPVTITPASEQLALDKPNAGLQSIVLQSRDGRDFAISSFVSSGNAITAKIDPRFRSSRHTIEPSVDIEQLGKHLNGHIEIGIDYPGVHQVVFNYNTPAEFEAVPGNFFIQQAISGQPQQRELWVLSNYNSPFEVESVSSEKGIVTLIGQESLQTKHKLTMQIMPPKQERLRYLNDTVSIVIKDGPTLTVNVSGWLKDAD